MVYIKFSMLKLSLAIISLTIYSVGLKDYLCVISKNSVQ